MLKQLVDIGKRLYEKRYLRERQENLSVRLDSSEKAITPTNKPKWTLISFLCHISGKKYKKLPVRLLRELEL